MIKFFDDEKLFLLSGKNYDYALFVDEFGYLEFLYFGTKIGFEIFNILDNAKADLLKASKAYSPYNNNVNQNMVLDVVPQEYSFIGRGDFRTPSAIISRQDGAIMSEFKYLSYSVSDTAVKLGGLPCCRKGQTLSIILKDVCSDITVRLNYVVNDDSDVIVRNADIVNGGKDSVYLKRAYSFCIDLPKDEYKVMSLAGCWANERVNFAPQKIQYGVNQISSLRSRTHNLNPFVAVLKDDCTEESGNCFGFCLLYSGAFSLNTELSPCGQVRITGGINDLIFNWELKSEEVFQRPQTAVCFSDGGIGQMSRSFADFYRDCIISSYFKNKKRPIVINNWEATYFDFNNEKLMSIIDKAAEVGIDTFVLDDGWFGHRNNDASSLGDWFVNEDKLQGGFSTIINYCTKKGLKFGLWFEPEMISIDSELYKRHPEFAVSKKGIKPCQGRNQLVLDFTKKEVVDYIYEKISDVLRNNDISYVKWDMNRDLTEYFSYSLPATRQGEFLHRYILGVYDLASRLTSEFKEVLFEGCAGGGGRFDGGMLYYFPQIWTSDDTDGFERTKIQYGTSICYPVSAMSCHVSTCPNHQCLRTTPFDTRGLIASLGPMGYELDLSVITSEEKEKIKRQIKDYEKIRDLILTGDLYRFKSPISDDAFAVMLVDKSKDNAYFVFEIGRSNFFDLDKKVYLYGLDLQKDYYIEEWDKTIKGKTLLYGGVKIPRLLDYDAFCLHLKSINTNLKV